MISHSTKDPAIAENLRPDIIGGHDLSSLRSVFDKDDAHLIVSSNRKLLYYDLKTCNLVGRVQLNSSHLEQHERIVSCERMENSLYIGTSQGKVFTWSLEARDWNNELVLPLQEDETLISCKMLSKRQYIYSILNNTSNTITLHYSMSRSERERPKNRELINTCSFGTQNAFDIGCVSENIDSNSAKDASSIKSSKRRILVFIDDNQIHFVRVSINEKLSEKKSKLTIHKANFTCVRANLRQPMIAAGDSSGRIYLYTGDFNELEFQRTRLHWHHMQVNDLCFSTTGNTLFSVGGESGCVVIWDLSNNNIGQKQIIPRLGMPIRYITCGNSLNQLALTFEDNEIQFMDTDCKTKEIKSLTRRTIDMYLKNDPKALRIGSKLGIDSIKSVGLLWYSRSDTVMTNGKTGRLQFYSPKKQIRVAECNFLKANILSLEMTRKVVPSDITRAALSSDGSWLAFYETRESMDLFPEVKLHLWQFSDTNNRWVWIQTADRLHSSTTIVDLKFSSDGQFIVSVCADGTFQLLHRICLDSKASVNMNNAKQMYIKGFTGTVPKSLPALVTFSRDSSVMAMSLRNDTTLIWTIVDPYKLVYECQLNQIQVSMETRDEVEECKPNHQVVGLHFGHHQPSQGIAPLCEVRSKTIRIWNILDPQETMGYPSEDESTVATQFGDFTAAAFDQCIDDDLLLDHFAVSTSKDQIMIFKLEINPNSRLLDPLIIIDASLVSLNSSVPTYYTDMCFLRNPILEIDRQCHKNPKIVALLNRLCLMNTNQELIGITDKLTLERESAVNSCNEVKTFDVTELREYFAKSVENYRDEIRNISNSSELESHTITEKQRKIRRRLGVQKMLKDLFVRIPSHNLPQMTTLGPMILDKLI